MTAAFAGFGAEAFQFLVDLAMNNDRSWFQPRKAEFERLWKEPLEALCVALDAELTARDLPFSADPHRSPFRIYRDVRFAKDKSPYKTAVSASFPWTGPGGGVGGYVHFQPGESFIGGGLWHPAPARLLACSPGGPRSSRIGRACTGCLMRLSSELRSGRSTTTVSR
ncbi:MAG: DUF2461 domain-containing protein [Candidatus Limnocylindrales bacterium]